MANRTMQAKALKLQRQLRKLPRRVSDPAGSFTEHSGTPIPARLKAEGVTAPRTPNRELIGGYKHRANSLTKEDTLPKYPGVHQGRVEARARIRELKASETDPSIDKLLRYVKARL